MLITAILLELWLLLLILVPVVGLPSVTIFCIVVYKKKKGWFFANFIFDVLHMNIQSLFPLCGLVRCHSH